MSRLVPDVKIVCSHGLDGVEPAEVENFRFVERTGSWRPTRAPRRLQPIEGNTPFNFATTDDSTVAVRLRYTNTCPLQPACRAQFKRRWEDLEPELFAAAQHGPRIIDIKPGPKRRDEIEQERARRKALQEAHEAAIKSRPNIRNTRPL